MCVPPLTRFHTKKHCPRKSLRKYAVVCKLNSLMTFSLEELTAKCSLRLPKGRSAWLRVAQLHMKHCFQATTTGSCISLGKGKRKERTKQSNDRRTQGISHPKSPSPQGLVSVRVLHGGKRWGGVWLSRQGAAQLGRLNSRAALLWKYFLWECASLRNQEQQQGWVSFV